MQGTEELLSDEQREGRTDTNAALEHPAAAHLVFASNTSTHACRSPL
jgi:hypothetical protein